MRALRQKEAYYFGKPCIIAHPETEWVEIVEAGAGILADDDEQAIVTAATGSINNPPVVFPEVFGDGSASKFIFNEILKQSAG